MDAAARELSEETSISFCHVTYLPRPVHLSVVSAPAASAVFNIHVFAATLLSTDIAPVAASDAAGARFVPLDALSDLETVPHLDVSIQAALDAVCGGHVGHAAPQT